MEANNNNYRNKLALIIILSSIGAILIISTVFLINSDTQESSEKLFNSLLPLFATWIGTVLAFYFGRENFNAASRRYNEIIKSLTPDLLDKISVRQIMISKKTMVLKEYDDIQKKSITELVDFLNNVEKSRLPVLQNNKPKYIIHKKYLLEFLNMPDHSTTSFEEFERTNKELLERFIITNPKNALEEILKILKEKESIKDIFVVDDNKNVLGWLTDSMIMRYFSLPK